MQRPQNPINVVQDAGSAAAMLNPVRMQILEQLREPNSASGLAKVLELPRQKLNYHLRELEKKGLVELVEERRKGNCTERIMKATAQSYLVSLPAVGDAHQKALELKDKFSSQYQVAVASNIIQEVATLSARAEKAKKKLSTLTLQTELEFASPQDLNAFSEELSEALLQLVEKYNRPKEKGARRYKFTLCSHPSITKSK